AYHLKESGAFGPAALLRHGPNVQGVNWSGIAAPAGINWTNVRQMTLGPNGTATQPVQPDWVGPGKPMPMLNVVEVDRAGNIVLHLPGRAPLPVSENEFLALLTLDPAYRTTALGNPVLFLTTGDGALSPQVIQRFSQNTGRPGFAYGAPMTLTSPSPSIPLGILARLDPATQAPARWTAATRQSTVPGTSDTDDGLIVFDAGNAFGGGTVRDAEMSLFAPPGSAAPPASAASAWALAASAWGPAASASGPAASIWGPPAPKPAVNLPAPPAVSGRFTGPNDPLLSPQTVMAGFFVRSQGRNWTGKPVDRVLLGRARVVEIRPGAAPKDVSNDPAPWPDDAYVVAAEGENGRVRLPDGRVLGAEGVADVLAADPELAKLPKDVPVVLAIPFAGQQYQEMLQVVADRLGRTVWGPSGEGRVFQGSGTTYVLALIDRDPDAAVGAWMSTPPSATTTSYTDREWTALDGTKFRDSDVYSRPLVDENSERFGRLAVPLRDGLRRREQRFRIFRQMRRLVFWTPAGTGYQDAGSEEITPDPAVYVYAAHGKPGRMQLPLRDGRTVWLDKRDAAAYIAGLREVRDLPPGHRVHLEVCWSDSDGDPRQEQPSASPAPHVDDPLDDVPLDQLVSNLSRLETDGATRQTGMDSSRRAVVGAANGVFGRRVRRRPEPLDHELDRLARDAGVHRGPGAVSPETRKTTLRLVRALRSAFGNEIEDDRGVPGGRYERVLRGIGALERMRANDPAISQFTPFRLDMFDFFVQEHTGRAPDLAGYMALLDFAAARVAADPGARLTDAVPAPALQVTLKQLADKGVHVIGYVQSLSSSAAFSARHVASTLWAMSRVAQTFGSMTTAEQEAVGRKVLHVNAAAVWDQSQEVGLWVLASKAIAEGLDISDRDLLAAYHLKESGAFGPAALLRKGPDVQGVNWSGTPASAGIDGGNVRQMTYGPHGTSMQLVQPDWVGSGKPPPVLSVVEVDQAGNIVLHLPGYAPLRVSEDEFLALMDLNPALRSAGLGTPVLFLTTGPGALSPRLVERYSQRTGRPAFGYGAPMMLTSAAPSIPLRILALPDPATMTPGPWTAATRQLTTPQTTTTDNNLIVFGSTAPTALARPEGSTRSVLSRAELTRRVHLVAGRGPARGMSVERCLVLLRGLRDELYGGGVRPAVALDDWAVGDTSAASSLVMGPGWRGVRSWQSVADAVTAAGPGAAAFILAQRQGEAPGHAWAAYNLGGTDGVVWVDVSAGAEGRVSEVPPEVAASDAQAVVIDSAGQAIDPDGRDVVDGALPPFAQSSSTTHAILDAPTGDDYDGVGLEAEERRDLFLSVPGNVKQTLVLAHGPGLKLVTDSYSFWETEDGLLHIQRPQVAAGERQPVRRKYVIGEFVVEPMAAIPGERKQSRREAMAQLRRARAAARLADERRQAIPLPELLGPLGWTFTEVGKGAKVNPAPEGFDWSAYAQLTAGYATDRLRELQDLAFERLTRPGLAHVMAGGRSFGQILTTMFVDRALGQGAVENHLVQFLAAIPDVDEVWGYGWLGYQNVAAAPVSTIFDNALPEGVDPTLIKNLLPVASRNALDRVLRALRPRTRTFLNERHDELTRRLHPHLSEVMEHYRRTLTPDKSFDAGFFDAVGNDVPTPREHWTAVLTGRTSEGAAISQRYAVGMDDGDYPTLDTDDGRLAVALVLLELRHFGYTGKHMMPEEIERAVEELSKFSRSAYERSVMLRAPLPEDVLRESILRIVNNPVVRAVAAFLAVTVGEGVPQVDGSTKKLMAEWDSRNIALTLGEYALGSRLPADDPAVPRLRAAVAEAFDLLPQVPPGAQARVRAVFEAARNALGVLADPAQTPPVMPWAAEIVALDGSRVLLDRVQVAKHRDADGKPVGVSSRPVQDWQDAWRQSYGLLPDVSGFTHVRRGPVPLESPVQSLPFGEAHLVGLRGDASAAALALSDGTDAVFDYARIV
ncbi:lonely Cys domain-containing protein, partial [Streptomyces sp. NPDC004749]